jgi:SAM-dependent methyltransferase
MAAKLDRLLRKLVPSTALLSRSLPGSATLRVADLVARPLLRIFTHQPVPPLTYIVRTGVSNSIFFPHNYYLTASANMWMYFFAQGYAKLDSTIVDIGSGVGKGAVGLRDFAYNGGVRFAGTYHGFDIDPKMVAWCKENFPGDRFRFTWLDVESTVYNPQGDRMAKPKLDVSDSTADLVFSQSLFSHLLEADIEHYLAESFRMLRPGGSMLMTYFCFEDMEALGLIGGRWTFAHRLGAARVENVKYPESAVAYSREWIEDAARHQGFREVSTVLPAHQSTLMCVR